MPQDQADTQEPITLNDLSPQERYHLWTWAGDLDRYEQVTLSPETRPEDWIREGDVITSMGTRTPNNLYNAWYIIDKADSVAVSMLQPDTIFCFASLTTTRTMPAGELNVQYWRRTDIDYPIDFPDDSTAT